MTQPTARRDELFGHPRGLTVLSTTEMWERFSFYGMQALLMLYMTQYLLRPEQAAKVLGLGATRAALSATFGSMTDLAFAAQIYGIYSGLIYGTPLIGAWIGDRVLGRTKTVIIGCVLMSAGHLAMASEHFFLVALLLIVVGAGGVVGNMTAQVGLLYEPEDDRRTRAFGVYLITLNIGALAAPLVIGTLGEKVAWHWGFGAAGVGMIIGMITYLAGRRHLPPDPLVKGQERVRLIPAERQRVWALLLLILPNVLANVPMFQAYGVMYVWADKAVNRNILGWDVPVTWIGIIDGLFTILGVLICNRLWKWQNSRGTEPKDYDKVTIGYVICGAAWVFAAAIALMPVVPVLMWIAFFAILDFSFGWLQAPLQSLVSREAPMSMVAIMLAVLKATTMIGYFILGYTGRFYEPMGPSLFWLFTGSFAGVAVLMMLAMRRRLLREFEVPGEDLEAEPVVTAT